MLDVTGVKMFFDVIEEDGTTDHANNLFDCSNRFKLGCASSNESYCSWSQRCFVTTKATLPPIYLS